MPQQTDTHKELTQDEIDLYFFYRKEGLKSGFFKRYFHHLQKSRTTFEAFASANDEFFDLFGEKKYQSITSFRNQLKKHLSE